jgi:hypothetical protein
VDDVEVAARQRQRQVRPDADRQSDSAPPGDRHGGPERDYVRPSAVLERPPAGEQVRGAVGRGEDGDLVPQVAQCPCGTSDVLVDVMRL